MGGKSSGINDRRNWDSYLVDGLVRKLEVALPPKMRRVMNGGKILLKLMLNEIFLKVVTSLPSFLEELQKNI